MRPIPTYERLNSKIIKNPRNGCWEIKPHKHQRYPTIKPSGSRKDVIASRYIYELYIGKIPKGMCVCHKCDNTHCINPNHLWLGTQKDNMNDMIKKKRDNYQRGLKHPLCKLTRELILEIKEQYKNGNSTINIAKKYNYTLGVIEGIIYGKTYIGIGEKIITRENRKINKKDIQKIIEEYESGIKRSIIARKYNVSWTAIDRTIKDFYENKNS